MDYEVNIIVHILYMLNLGWSVTSMERGRAQWEFHGHLARFPLHLWNLSHQWWIFYDSYETSQIWRLKYWHTDISGLNRAYRGQIWELEKAKRLLLKFGRRGKVKWEATWHNMRSHTIRLGFGLCMYLET